jgi:hypothetical protein
MKRVDSGLVPDLRPRAFAGRFVGTPTDEFGAVAEALAGETIVLHFDDEL